MYRLTLLYGQPEDQASFEEYYHGVHVPLALQIPGLQKFTYGQVSPDEDDSVYAIAALDWDDEASFAAGMSSPEGERAREDVPRFASGGVTMLQTEIDDLLRGSSSVGAAQP